MEDMTSRRFGKLVIIGRATNDQHRRSRWNTRCDCGSTDVVVGTALRRGITTSCGCHMRQSTRRHGMRRTPTYQSWKSMKYRCDSPDFRGYRYYGGRGIAVCDRWYEFVAFLADMGERPPGTTLDRIDPDGDYEPGNCRWADPTTQANNRRIA